MNVLVIWANGTIQEKSIGTRLEDLQREVGGRLEHVDLSHGVHGWLNEEGKLLGLPLNREATALCVGARAIDPSNHIVGSMCFTGADCEGNCCNCPQRFIDHVRLFIPENFQ